MIRYIEAEWGGRNRNPRRSLSYSQFVCLQKKIDLISSMKNAQGVVKLIERGEFLSYITAYKITFFFPNIPSSPYDCCFYRTNTLRKSSRW
jgi:hypothetical protein